MKHVGRWLHVRAVSLVCGATAMVALFAAPALSAEEEADFKIHEISLWGFDPTLEQANQLQHYPSVMPGVVDTDRSRAGSEVKVAPFSLITFHGQGVKNLEIDLRVQSGRFVAHWPAGESKSGRLRWIDATTSIEPNQEGRVAAVDAKHWFTAARQLDALYLQLGARTERFIIYDAELKLDQPLQISGGPDRYRLANLSKTPLHDVLVVAPEAGGRRIGRLAVLPAKPQKPTESKPAAPKPDEKKPAEAKPADAKPENKPSDEKQPDAKKPGEEPPKAEQAEEKKAEAKSEEAKPAPAAVANAATPAAGTPTAPAQAPAAKDTAAAKQAAVAAQAGPPVEVEMSAPLADGAPELSEARRSLAESLQQQGLAEAEVELFMERAAPAIFRAKEMIVVCRLPGDAVEERLPLVTYPAALKTVRAAVLVLRNIDPKIKDDVERLVTNLGAADYAERETAEKRLGELGRLAVPALKEALKASDAEVQFRAERLLLAQNEKVDGT